MNENPILAEVTDRVLTLTLNNPEKLNPVSVEMTGAAISRLQAAAKDPDVGAIVLKGAGRGFCSGGDLSRMNGGRTEGTQSRSYEEMVDQQRAAHQFPLLLHSLPKVTIASVHGPAAGAGLGLALSCDLRFASETARFGTAFARVGLSGDFGTTWQLTRLLGEAKAKELFFLPDMIDASEALRIGLVNRVLSEDSFQEQVHALAARIASGPLASYRWMKENIQLASLTDFGTMLDREAVTHVRCSQTQDHAEGVAAFLERRKPLFKGR